MPLTLRADPIGPGQVRPARPSTRSSGRIGSARPAGCRCRRVPRGCASRSVVAAGSAGGCAHQRYGTGVVVTSSCG